MNRTYDNFFSLLIIGNGDGNALKCTKNIPSHITNIEKPKTISDSSEKPYSCSFCKKAFSRKGTKRIHERIHTGEKPFSCDECNKCFSDPAVLVRHKKFVHSKERPYPCNYCNSKFKQQYDLKHHVLTTHAGGKYLFPLRSAGIIIFHGLQMRVLKEKYDINA